MLMTQTAIRTLLNNGETDSSHFLNSLNRTIYDNVERMQTDKSLNLVLLDYKAGKVTLSGQHEQVIIVRRGGHIELIDTLNLGFPIGLDENISKFLGETSLNLESGDGVVLYTDGITEAENMSHGQYGLERLCEVITHSWELPVEGIKQAIVTDVKQYIGEQEIYDDLTLVVLKQK